MRGRINGGANESDAVVVARVKVRCDCDPVFVDGAVIRVELWRQVRREGDVHGSSGAVR